MQVIRENDSLRIEVWAVDSPDARVAGNFTLAYRPNGVNGFDPDSS